MMKSTTVMMILGLLLASCEKEQEKDSSKAASIPEWVTELSGSVTYRLDDGEVLNRSHPDTFWIPSRQRRENLVDGDLVKLIFELDDGEQIQRERMWVLVEGREGSKYRGLLDNDPVSTDEIKSGMEVLFEARHVIDVYEPELPDE